MNLEQQYENIPEPNDGILAIVNTGQTSNPKAAIRYFSNPKKQVKNGFWGEVEAGFPVGTPAELTELLLAGHHDRRCKRVCRTMVLSIQTPPDAQAEQLEDIDKRLILACKDLAKLLRIAHGCLSILCWIHGNTSVRHAHVLFSNSNGFKQLNLNPQFLRDVQSMFWTKQFKSGRGKGKFPTPKNYYIQQKVALAAVLAPKGKLDEDRLNQLIKEGICTNLRTREDGSVISFEYQNRRFRITGLKEVFKPSTQNRPMINIINPDKPLPTTVIQTFQDCGVTSAEVQEILKDIREALASMAAAPVIEPEPPKSPNLN